MYESNNLFLVMGTFIFAIVCFSIIFTIVEIIARIKIFEKIGVPIWKGIIPFYSDYILAENVWDSKFIVLEWILLLASIIASAMTGIKFIGIIFRIIAFIIPFAIAAIRFRMNMWLSKSFNKSTGFTIGLFFLPVIFELILGFDKSQYEGNLFLDSEDDF